MLCGFLTGRQHLEGLVLRGRDGGGQVLQEEGLVSHVGQRTRCQRGRAVRLDGGGTLSTRSRRTRYIFTCNVPPRGTDEARDEASRLNRS